MKIILNDEYYIKADPLNYELVNRRRNKNADNPKANIKNLYSERTVGYFVRLTQAVNRFVDCIHKDKTTAFEGTMLEYCELIKKMDEELKAELSEKVQVIVEESNGNL